jgi:hypothetical protein
MTVARRALLVALAAMVAVLAVPMAAAAQPLLQLKVELDGRIARDRAGEKPIRLDPARKIPLRIAVHNAGDEPANIRHVRLDGEALGLQFLTYDVTVNERVPPGETRKITVPLDLYDLGNQATGYLPAAVRVYNARRDELASQKFVADIRGKATSTLGIFAIALLVLAFVSLGTLIYQLIRRQLSRNRALRGLQFMLAGAAVGLVLALGLPILRLTAIQPDGWIPLALGPMAIGFVLGYLAPGPLSYSIEEVHEEELLDIVATQAVERRTADLEAARLSSETVMASMGSAAAHTPAPITSVAAGERASGPAPVTTVTGGERTSGPAPATAAAAAQRASGPAPATSAGPAQRASGPAPATSAGPAQRASGPAPATTAGPAASSDEPPSPEPDDEPLADDDPGDS